CRRHSHARRRRCRTSSSRGSSSASAPTTPPALPAPRLPAGAGAISSPTQPSTAGASSCTAPMVGVMCEGLWHGVEDPFARFIPTSSCLPPRADHRGWMLFDARHGRVLLYRIYRGELDFVVWDPIMDKLVELPRPPENLVGNR
ncbi:unnamed protein product, partial [Urochloa humidicola]